MINSLNLFSRTYNLENLYHAWNKIKYVYENESDFVINRNEFALFEADLKNNLESLSNEIKCETYVLNPLIPMPLPKGADDGKKQNRQNFFVSLVDQIVWIALVNIIGPILDNQMPFWSFGNRLYMPIWKEQISDDVKKVKFGAYRSSSRKIYRNWSSSWPLFRKSISITAKKMYNSKLTDEEYVDEEEYSESPETLKIKYWEKDYWNIPVDSNIYYATIDLKKFYPSIDMRKIFDEEIFRIIFQGRFLRAEDNKLKLLISKLCDFKIHEDYILADETIFPHVDGDMYEGKYLGLPTGLLVAGFLSNVAMFHVDNEIHKKITKNRNTAHFRFVDDHVILATSLDCLSQYIDEYKAIIRKCLSRVELNTDKTSPNEFQEYFSCYLTIETDTEVDSSIKAKAEFACKLDKLLPTPFTTLTLKKMSGLNKDPFEIMDEDEKMEFVTEVEHLLVAEFPDNEIKKETRVSWAATMLARIVPLINFGIEDIYKSGKEVETIYFYLQDKYGKYLPEEISSCKGNIEQITKMFETLKEKDTVKYSNIESQLGELKRANEIERKLVNKRSKMENTLLERVFLLLCKALKDNVSKPKIWKKLVAFCRSTGYKRLDTIFEMLADDLTLLDSGKEYIYATILSEISRNVLIAVKVIKQKSSFEEDVNRNIAFIDAARKIITYIEEKALSQNMFFMKELLEQFKCAMNFADCELNGEKYFNDEIDNKYALSYLWYSTKMVVESFGNVSPASLQEVTIENGIDMQPLKEKLLLMYRPEDAHGQTLSNGYINLFSFMEKNIHHGNSSDFSHMLSSEWTALEILEKVIDVITSYDDEFSFEAARKMDERNYYNCHPLNYKFTDIVKENNWTDYKKQWNAIKFEYQDVRKDTRFESEFYNNFGSFDTEKEQVYSLCILLVQLVSKKFSFNPLLNRGDSIEKNQFLFWDKLYSTHVSSYTRAIIKGGLSYRHFELEYLSFFDSFFARDDDSDNDPIKIDCINDLHKHICEAQKCLERFQLSLEDNKPRQIIPISLKNLTKMFNPYSTREEG